jgi:alpha-N-arabinofuranosidase
MWDDKDVNSFGTDEFVAMCRKVGAEPIIVVNIGTENWNQNAHDNDFLQEALDWIEYCNGTADSRWGSVRAANGHPEPYGVKYWEIDNETWHMGADAYAAAVNRFGSAMRRADPSIIVIACGSGGYSQSWNRTVINKAGKNFDYISTHHYESPNNFATGPSRDEEFYLELKQIIDDGPNADIKVYCSEWNAQSTDWRTGLYCGGILNVFERCGEFFKVGGPALFLRHVSASAWDNAFINFDHRSWFPAPNYVVMKLWRDHYAPYRIAVMGESGNLNVVATRSDDGKMVYLKAVNPSRESLAVEVKLDGQAVASTTLRLVAPGSLAARNTLAERGVVRVEEGKIELEDQAVRFTMPPLSCGVAAMKCE